MRKQNSGSLIVPAILISLFCLSSAASASLTMAIDNRSSDIQTIPLITTSLPEYDPTEVYTSDYIINTPITINNSEIELRNSRIVINSDDVHIYNSHLVPIHGGYKTHIIKINPGFSNITIKNTVFEDDSNLMSGYPIVEGENLSNIVFHNNTMKPRWGVSRELAFQYSNSIDIVNPRGFGKITTHYSDNISISDADLLRLYIYECTNVVTNNVSMSASQVRFSSNIEFNDGGVSTTFSTVSSTDIRYINMTATGNSFNLYDSNNIVISNSTIDLNHQFFRASNITNSKFSHNIFMDDVTKVELVNVSNSIFINNTHQYSYSYSNGYELIGNNYALTFTNNTFLMSQAAIYQSSSTQNQIYNISISDNEFESGIGVNINGNNEKLSISNNTFNTNGVAITGEYYLADFNNNKLLANSRVINLQGEDNILRYNSFYAISIGEHWIEMDGSNLLFDSNTIYNTDSSVITPLKLSGDSNTVTNNVIYSQRSEWINTWSTTQLSNNIVHLEDNFAPEISHNIGSTMEIYDVSNYWIEFWDMNPSEIDIYIDELLWKTLNIIQDYPKLDRVEFQFEDTLFSLNLSYNITLVAKDLFNNQFIESIDLLITPDSTAPTMSMAYPSFTFGTYPHVEISYQVYDSTSNGSVEVFIDDIFYTTLGWNEPLYIDTTDFEIGLHSYTLVVTDRNGLENSNQASFAIKADESEPYITHPDRNEDVWVLEVTYPSDIGSIDWRIRDNSFGYYQIIIDDVVVEEGEWFGETIVSYTPSFTDKGEYIIVIIAVDISGNVGGGGVGVIVDKDEPLPKSSTTQSTSHSTSNDRLSTNSTTNNNSENTDSDDTDDEDANFIMSPIMLILLVITYSRIKYQKKLQ